MTQYLISIDKVMRQTSQHTLSTDNKTLPQSTQTGTSQNKKNLLDATEFVIKTTFWSGQLTYTLALYGTFILLGLVPYLTTSALKNFYSSVSGSSMNMFVIAFFSYVATVVASQIFQSYLKMVSRDTSARQQHALRYSIADSLAKTNNGDTITNVTGQQIVNDTEKLYNSVNKIIEMGLQSLTTIISSIVMLVSQGMWKAAASATITTAVITYCIYQYCMNTTLILDMINNNAKDTGRNKVVGYCKDPSSENHSNVVKAMASLQTSVLALNRGDYWPDVINNILRECGPSICIFICVVTSASIFPLTKNNVNGEPVTSALILTTAKSLNDIVTNLSILVKNYQDVYQAPSSYQNISSSTERYGIDSNVTALSNKDVDQQFKKSTRIEGSLRTHFIAHTTESGLCAAGLIAAGKFATSWSSVTPTVMATSLIILSVVIYSSTRKPPYNRQAFSGDDRFFNTISMAVAAVFIGFIFSRFTVPVAITTCVSTLGVFNSLVLASWLLYSVSSAVGYYTKPLEGLVNRLSSGLKTPSASQESSLDHPFESDRLKSEELGSQDIAHANNRDLEEAGSDIEKKRESNSPIDEALLRHNSVDSTDSTFNPTCSIM